MTHVFFLKRGLYLIDVSGGLQPNTYRDILERKENYIQTLASFSLVAGDQINRIEAAALPTKKLQRLKTAHVIEVIVQNVSAITTVYRHCLTATKIIFLKKNRYYIPFLIL